MIFIRLVYFMMLAFGWVAVDAAHFTNNQAIASQAARATITIPKDSMSKGEAAYSPNPLVINPGTEVTWKNDDTVAHTATSESGVFDSGFILPGQSYSRVFEQRGEFPYYCTLHGKNSMSGTVEVK